MYNDLEHVRVTRFDNGITLLTEQVAAVESVAVGIWADAGSAEEATEEFGAAHFLEHMLFKGTATRSAFALAETIEDVGGQINAYTERETTHLVAHTLAEHLPLSLDVMVDMIRNSVFPRDEYERERQVIIEEIRRYEALPEDRVHDQLLDGVWHGGGLGHPILGTEDSVRQMPLATVINTWQRHFTPERMLVAIAGKIEHDACCALVEDALGTMPAMGIPPNPVPIGEQHRLRIDEADEEQVSFCWGGRSYPAHDPRNYALALADMVLGASATSRLFQEIREKRGLAYDIASFAAGFRDTGLIGASGATSPEFFVETLTLVRETIDALRQQGMTPKEFARAKAQLKAGIALGLEGTMDRMRRLATHYLTWGEVYPLGYLIGQIERVTLDEVMQVMQEVCDLSRWTFASVGPVTQAEIEQILM